MRDGNGDGDHDVAANEEFDRLVIGLRAVREQTETGAETSDWPPAVVRFVRALAERESERFPPMLREQVEQAVARGAAHTLSLALRIWFEPVAR